MMFVEGVQHCALPNALPQRCFDSSTLIQIVVVLDSYVDKLG